MLLILFIAFPSSSDKFYQGKVKLNVSTKLGKRFPHEGNERIILRCYENSSEYTRQLLLWRVTSCKRKSIVIGLVFGYICGARRARHFIPAHDDNQSTYNVCCDADSDNFYQLLATCVQACPRDDDLLRVETRKRC